MSRFSAKPELIEAVYKKVDETMKAIVEVSGLVGVWDHQIVLVQREFPHASMVLGNHDPVRLLTWVLAFLLAPNEDDPRKRLLALLAHAADRYFEEELDGMLVIVRQKKTGDATMMRVGEWSDEQAVGILSRIATILSGVPKKAPKDAVVN